MTSVYRTASAYFSRIDRVFSSRPVSPVVYAIPSTQGRVAHGRRSRAAIARALRSPRPLPLIRGSLKTAPAAPSSPHTQSASLQAAAAAATVPSLRTRGYRRLPRTLRRRGAPLGWTRPRRQKVSSQPPRMPAAACIMRFPPSLPYTLPPVRRRGIPALPLSVSSASRPAPKGPRACCAHTRAWRAAFAFRWTFVARRPSACCAGGRAGRTAAGYSQCMPRAGGRVGRRTSGGSA